MERWRRLRGEEVPPAPFMRSPDHAELGHHAHPSRHRGLLPAISYGDRGAIQKLPVVTQRPLGVPGHLIASRGYASNPSLCRRSDGSIALSVRMHVETEGRSELLLGRLNEDTLDAVDMHTANDTTGAPRSRGMSAGIEDARLFELQGHLMAVASCSDRVSGDPKPKAVVLELSSDGHIAAAHVQPSNHMEKNWMPASDGNVCSLVYSTDPLVVLRYDMGLRTTTPGAPDAQIRGSLRGGSALIPFEKGWLAVVHESHAPAQNDRFPLYLQRFVYFDEALTETRIGRPWYFSKLGGIEFGSGLCRLSSGRLALTYGIDDNDKAANIAVIEPNIPMELM